MAVPYAKPKPRGMLRLLLRCPPFLYRRGLARRMGPRFLLLTTTGRKTGLARTVGLNYAREGHTVYVISGFGRTDWYRNLVAFAEVEVQVGTERWRGLARPVSDPIERERAGRLFSDQAVGQSPPSAVRSLLRRLGLDYEAEVRRVRDPGLELPIVTIERRDPGAGGTLLVDGRSSGLREPAGNAKTRAMRRRNPGWQLAVLAACVAYGVWYRPRMSRWGATDEEVMKVLPGNELESSTGYRPISTRAITIDAPPDAVWPWVIQMGSGRAGFYTHEWVERLLFITYADGHSSRRIHPEWQKLHVGDRVPYSRFNTVPVALVDASRCLVAGEWIVLEPLDDGARTRLIARTRGGWLEPFARRVPGLKPLLWPIAALVDRGPLELLHHYMETGMLKGIKARAESEPGAHPPARAGA